MFKLLPCCLALLAIAIGESADIQLRASGTQSIEQQHFRPKTLLTPLETWVSSQFDLPAIHEHPSIEFASPAKIVSLRFAGLLSDPGEQVAPNDRASSAQHDTIAIYYDATRTIYLPEGWTGDTPAELSVLVHEVVHHFQNVLRLKYECPQEREKLAYIAQDRWLALFGHSLESDFHMDAFSLLVKTQCFW
ncbi:MAG TPA: DUF6647 family protein [Bradyrhizobium sp.]|nr:DUF6647 family protein [Bradyrhizobium sp.]